MKQIRQSGFSLLETLVVLAVMGILGAIAIPNWITFLAELELNTAQDRIYRVIRDAQVQARSDSTTWQASFRQEGNQLYWSVHRALPGEFMPPGVPWTPLAQNILIDGLETTLQCPEQTCSDATTRWRVQFNHKGHANGQLGRITLKSPKGGKMRRCIFVSTLLGNLRTSEEQPRPDKTNRYCH